MKRNLVKIVTLCAAVALCLSAVLCFSLTASASDVTIFDQDVTATVTIGAGSGVYLNVAGADTAIQTDYATNGLPDQYVITVTASANAAASVYPCIVTTGGTDIWAPRGQTGCSYGAATTSTDLVNVIPASEFEAHANGQAPNKIWCYSDEGATLSVTHVKVVVTRDGAADPSDEPVVSEDSDVVSEDSDVVSEDSDVVSEDSDVVSEDSDVVSEDSENSETSDVTSEDSEDSEDSETSEPVEFMYGDADGDGDITMKDVLAMRKSIANMDVEINDKAADVDGDGEVTMKDVLLVRKYIAKIITEFPVEAEASEDSEIPSEDSEIVSEGSEDSEVVSEDSEVVSEDSEVSEEISEEASEEI